MLSSEPILLHPNRDRPAARATRRAVIVLLLVSAVLIAVVTAGGWSVLAGQRVTLVAYVVLYLVLAWFTARWKRGVLPVAATLAVLLAVLAAAAAPAWFDRQGAGFAAPGPGNGRLGLVTALLVPVQILLVLAAARGFLQDWHVEVEQLPRDRPARAV